MAEYHLRAPLTDEDVMKLHIGDMVYLSGPCFTCRSKLQRYIFDEMHELPFKPEPGSMLIHNGPIVVKRESGWELMSFMPTSSIRFEKWGASSIKAWNLKLICGKTTMGEETQRAMQQYHCVHVSPRSVSPLLWIKSIEVKGVDLFDEMGSIEAPWHFELNELGPFVVDMDCYGNNLFNEIDGKVRDNKRRVYEELGISDDFRYTRLYGNENTCEP